MSRIGVISDTHDNLHTVRAAVALFNRTGVERVVHCGDIVAQFVLVELSRLRAPLTAVYGNCDGDRRALDGRAREFGFELADQPYGFEHGGRRFVVCHHPPESPPACDFLLHGHTHQLEHRQGHPAILNPGEACGMLTGRATAALLDYRTGEVEFVDLKGR